MFKHMLLKCSLVIGWMLVSMDNSWAGWDCRGADSPSACRQTGDSHTPDTDDREASAYAQKVDRYNSLVHQANAAAKAGDLEEAIRIAYEALKVLDDDGLQRRITIWKSRSLTDQASRATNLSDQIDLVRRALAIYEYKEGRDWLNNAQRRLEAQNLNDQGRSAFASGDYVRAESLFAQAQQKDPDPAYTQNVRDAANQNQIKQGVSQLTDTINQAQIASTTTTSSLDFMPAGSAAQGSVNKTFGTTSNPPNPDLESSVPAPAVTVHSTLEQLSSAAKSGQDAQKADKIEGAKDLTGCGSDRAPCRAPDPINFPKPAQTPGTLELASHIPDDAKAKNDPAIQNNLAWFDKLEKRKAETQMKMADIQKQIDSGAGDSAVLKAKKATLSNELSHDSADQVKAKDQIKKRLDDLSLPWNESPVQTGVAPVDTSPSNVSH